MRILYCTGRTLNQNKASTVTLVPNLNFVFIK